MDLSKIVKLVAVLAIVGVIFYFTGPGMQYRFESFTKSFPGDDAERDVFDEEGLSSLAGQYIFTFRYEKAAYVLETALDRYPEGANQFHNLYRLAKCYEKMEDWSGAADALRQLIDINASQYDDRVATNEQLELRLAKLVELHEL